MWNGDSGVWGWQGVAGWFVLKEKWSTDAMPGGNDQRQSRCRVAAAGAGTGGCKETAACAAAAMHSCMGAETDNWRRPGTPRRHCQVGGELPKMQTARTRRMRGPPSSPALTHQLMRKLPTYRPAQRARRCAPTEAQRRCCRGPPGAAAAGGCMGCHTACSCGRGAASVLHGAVLLAWACGRGGICGTRC